MKQSTAINIAYSNVPNIKDDVGMDDFVECGRADPTWTKAWNEFRRPAFYGTILQVMKKKELKTPET